MLGEALITTTGEVRATGSNGEGKKTEQARSTRLAKIEEMKENGGRIMI